MPLVALLQTVLTNGQAATTTAKIALLHHRRFIQVLAVGAAL
jgi:hypothetical protein